MGQAKNRGTFEERKAAAIAEGRKKENKPNVQQVRMAPRSPESTALVGALYASALMGGFGNWGRR